MRDVKKEIHIMDADYLHCLLKKRDNAHTIANVSRAARIFGFTALTVGLLAQEPISKVVGAAVVVISSITKAAASAKENNLDKQLEGLCGKSYHLMRNKKTATEPEEEQEQQ